MLWRQSMMVLDVPYPQEHHVFQDYSGHLDGYMSEDSPVWNLILLLVPS